MPGALRWYDRVSRLYAFPAFSDRWYRTARARAIHALDAHEGDVVIDLFCGTGVNFGPILDRIGRTGALLAVDGSAGMLRRAQERVRRERLNASQIRFVRKDLTALTPEFVAEILPSGRVPRVLITLGLGTLPNWEHCVRTLLSAVPAGTRISMMEVHYTKVNLAARLLDFIGAADCSHEVWEPLRAGSVDYREERHDPFRFLPGAVVVASGAIPAPAIVHARVSSSSQSRLL